MILNAKTQRKGNKEALQCHYIKAPIKIMLFKRITGFYIMALHGLFVFSLAKNKCLGLLAFSLHLCIFAFNF
jgi:hypothetical protein